MMKSWSKRGARLGGLMIAVTVAAGTLAAPAHSASKVRWETSLATAQKKAKASGKPILLDVYASWCGPCKMMDKYTYSNSAVIRESQKWIMLKIDGDKNEAISRKYNVEGFPTVLFLKANGQPVAGFAGFADADELLKQMRAAAPKARK